MPADRQPTRWAPNAIREGYLWVYGAAPKGARYQAMRIPTD
jgi:hypothetical protein